MRAFYRAPFPLFICLLALLTGSANSATLEVPREHKTIQAAINAATTGDTILVSPGVYRERIQLAPGLSLKSAGDDEKGKLGLKRAEAVIIDGGGAHSGENGDQAGVEMAAGSTLDGFTVTNVGVYDDEKWQKHYKTKGAEQSHEHIGVPGIPGIAVNGVNCVVKNNIVHHIGYTGITVQGRCSPRLSRNISYRNMGGGIGSMQGSTAVIEENTCFENFYAGIGHNDASPLVINNVCYGNIRAGIGISEGAQPIVRDNKCYQNRRAGIGIRTGEDTKPIVENNECYNNGLAGIGTREEAAPIIRGNVCYRNERAGIGVNHASPIIVGNEVYENEQAGIGQQNNAVTVLLDNYIHHNTWSGIGFDTTENGRSTVLNNRIVDNTTVAIGIRGGWTVLISGNTMSRQGGMPPILATFKGSTVTLTGNVIRGQGVAGIRTEGEIHAENNEFAGTYMKRSGMPNYAVWAFEGSRITMIGNKVHHWAHALYAAEADVSMINNTVSDFYETAFVIYNPPTPANVFGNTVYSINQNDQVFSIQGDEGVVDYNQMREPVKGR